jgi:predicted 2-oxoglutarate/Fe(II)-dependent dioxygenase YbiX
VILVKAQFLPATDCQALRACYDDGLRRGCFKPKGTDRTHIALSRVTTDEPFARLHLDVAERLRSHFALPPLRLDYCAYTRMPPGTSHPLHADAVTLDGRPNHTPLRVASAMVYLSESEVDFSGGAVLFPKLGVKVRPRIGLLAGFLTSREYQHAVPPVTAGVRDAVAIWFRLDDRRPEREPANGIETR